MSEDSLSNINRVDPASVDKTLKEALAHALLGSVFHKISGNGHSGQVLKGEKPSRYYTSAFLMPANPDDEGLDDETSPTRITASGFDFMVKAQATGSVGVHAQFSLYLRILPSADELRHEGVDFRLTHNIDRDVREQIRVRSREQWEERKEEFGGNRNHPDWNIAKANLAKDVYEIFRIYDNSNVVATDDGNDSGEIEDDAIAVRGFNVRPGDVTYPSSEVVRAERPIEKWVRIPIDVSHLEFQLDNPASHGMAIQESNNLIRRAITESVDKWLNSTDANTGGVLWAYPSRRTFTPSEIANWQDTLDEIRATTGAMNPDERRNSIAIPQLNIEWVISIKPDWSDRTRSAVHVALENRSVRPTQFVMETDESIFQLAIQCRIPDEAHSPMILDRVKSSYRYNQYLNYSALGFNCGIRDHSESGHVILQSEWMPKYALPKIEPTTHNIDCTFKSLSNSQKSLAAVREIANELRSWIDQLDIDVSDGLSESQTVKIENERAEFKNDLEAWNKEATMIQRGIDLLDRSCQSNAEENTAIPFRAWLLMNETMRRLSLGRYDSWRLFQLSFVLAALPNLITRMPEYSDDYDSELDDATTLLYFATGGGKSEAFFGLLVFSLFFDRLRGKSLGVTAMLRYPLRLLTVQQAQRASKVLAKAEIVRRENGVGGEPFSIGFWVGSGNTPNHHSQLGVSEIPFIDEVRVSEEELKSSNRKYQQVASDWLKLPICPFCKGETGLRRTRTENSDLEKGIVGHICFANQCEWNQLNESLTPLPFYIVDADIYSIAPSILLGTIDKLALIGQSPLTIKRILGMFGFSAWRDNISGRFINPTHREFDNRSENSIQLAPVYKDGQNVYFDPFPSLLIQDEAHLLEESLGTFAGLFETALLEVYNQLSPYHSSAAVAPNGLLRMPKIVAASATVSDPKRQIEALYQRKLIQFPHPGPRLYESFYAMPELRDQEQKERNIESSAYQRRIYATILTNGKPHTTASVAVLSAFHAQITFLFRSFVEGDKKTKDLAVLHLVEVLSDQSHSKAYVAAIGNAPIEHLATLIDLHRIALTYVTNKKGGDQILAAETDQVRKDHHRESLEHTNFERRLITGSVDAGLIQKVIEDAEHRPNVGEAFPELDTSLRSIVATSAISHGVDVEELNSMFFAGMPSNIAEYIQASSRVGRTHVGFSLLLPVPQRKRDRYIVETHDVFHRFLERMIQPPAIDRWAEKALARVVPSFFQTYLVSVLGISSLISKSEDQKNRAITYGRVSDVIGAAADPVSFREGIVNFISSAVGLTSEYGPPNDDFYKALIQTRVKQLFDDIRGNDMASLSMRDFFEQLARQSPESLEKPMTSLRDVDVPGYLVPAPNETGGKNAHLSNEQLAELMRFLRRGGGGIVGHDGE